MSELGLEPGQVATASGHIYMYHPQYGFSEIQKVILEPYLAIIKLQPIDASSVVARGLRKLDFSEFERMGFAIEFRLGKLKQTEKRVESPQLTWLLDESDEHETLSDEKSDYTPHYPNTSKSRKRLRSPSPDLSPRSPSKKKPKDPNRSSGRTAKYECTECDAAFSNSKHLRTHGIAFNHIGTIRPFSCDICGTAFRWKEDRNMHVRLRHPKEQEESPWLDRIRDSTMTLPMLQINPINSFEQVSTIFSFEADEMAKNEDAKICDTVPQFCPGPSATYLVDLAKLNHPHDIGNDSYGSWGKCSGRNQAYSVDFDKRTITRLSNNPNQKEVEDVKVHLTIKQRQYRHPQEQNLRKIIFVGYFGELNIPKWAIVSYEWRCTPYELEVKPHGNTKYTNKPYQPTAKSVRLLLKEHATQLTPKQNIQLVSEKMEKAAIGPAFLPRDGDQANRFRYKKKRANKN